MSATTSVPGHSRIECCSNNNQEGESAMSRRSNSRIAAIAGGAVAVALMSGNAWAQDKELVFGLQCDRTGATQTVGVFLCPGYHDYISFVNSKGGIEGYKIRVLEI